MATLFKKSLRKYRRLLPLLLFPACANANLALENEPLFLSNSVAPNLVITFDNGAGMALGFFPDSIALHSHLAAAKSFVFNKMAYDPNNTYHPGHSSTGATLPNASFNAVKLKIKDPLLLPAYVSDIYSNVNTAAINLSTHFRFPWNVLKANIAGLSDREFAAEAGDDSSSHAQAAYYYVRDINRVNCDVNDFLDNDCYEKKTVTPAEEQNFANWYQYHSLRYLKGKTVLSQTLHKLPSDMRLAWQTSRSNFITSNNNNKYVRELGEAGVKTALYSWLNNISPHKNYSSPLRESMIRAGQFFSDSATNNAYEIKPGSNAVGDDQELACRNNYHLLISSGNYDESGVVAIADSDKISGDLPDGERYEVNAEFRKIFPGEGAGSLADIAFHYWRTDLRTDLDDSVPYFLNSPESALSNISTEDYWNPLHNVATWQHMNNFIVGFGPGNVDPLSSADYENLLAGDLNWASPFTGNTEQKTNAKVDDLWHVAINSRGRYFSILSPEALASSLSFLPTVLEYRESSAASVSATSGSLSSGGALFQVGFNTRDWSGFVRRYPLSTGLGSTTDNCHSQPTGTLCDASAEVQASSTSNWNQRNVFTIDPSKTGFVTKGIALKGGATIQWGNLTAVQQSDVLAQQLDYALGDDSNETSNGGMLRSRSQSQRTLGAIVHAPPQFVGNGQTADGAYQILYPPSVSPSAQSHAGYLSSISGRNEMLYASANDGMLHAYLYQTGQSGLGSLTEKFAYLPDALFPHLDDYSNPAYTYRGLIDGDLSSADAFYNDAWHTVLVGAFRQGAKGLFALDVTTPQNFGSNDVLWEHSTRTGNNNDLGYIYSDISIVKSHATHSGEPQVWGAVVGNGYNSSNGNAVLIVLDISSGETIATIDTGIGLNESSSAPNNANRIANLNNGLGSPFLIDINRDFIVDYAYAGDLYGNFWRFNLQHANPANWSAELMFTANADQAITAQPVVAKSTRNGEVMVFIGTGKYLEASDDQLSNNDPIQSVYGFIERFETTPSVITPAHLAAQTVLSDQASGRGTKTRLISQNPIHYFQGAGLPGNPSQDGHLGWKLNLPRGERVIYQPVSRAGIIAVASTKPSVDACESGGSSWLMALDAHNGGRLNFQAFESNGDGIINNADSITYGGASLFTSGYQDASLGITSKPTILHDRQTNTDHIAVSGSSGKLAVIKLQGNHNAVGVRAWRRLH
ncbi:MAG: hypothetical protein JKY01_05545 [Pseudomonadales bacterium]|nr:hypothetical protein [Pseudomonadales bacterium]